MPTRSASCAARTRRPLSRRSRLEPVEHAVERGDDASDLVVARHLKSLAGTEQVDHLHPVRKVRQRRERTPQQNRVHGDREEQSGGDDDRFRQRDRSADGHRRDDQQDRDRRQQSCVDGEDAPEEGQARARHSPTLAPTSGRVADQAVPRLNGRHGAWTHVPLLRHIGHTSGGAGRTIPYVHTEHSKLSFWSGRGPGGRLGGSSTSCIITLLRSSSWSRCPPRGRGSMGSAPHP